MVNIKSVVLAGFAATALAAPASDVPVLLGKRLDCLDHLPASSLAYVNEAVQCINYLDSLGDQPCVAGVSGVSFCRRGWTQITGLAINLLAHETTSASCRNVARAAGYVMDKCSRGDGHVRGQHPAWGNGHLLVDIRLVKP